MAVIEFSNPAGVRAPGGRYSHVAAVTGANRWVVLAGQIGARPDGTVPEDAGAQCDQAMANVLACLKSQGMGPESIVKLTVYLTDAAYIAASREARSRSIVGLGQPQLTMFFRPFSGRMRTFFEAGFALKIIFSPVNGLVPSRSFVAGFFTTFSFMRPGTVNSPPLRRLFRMQPLSESSTLLACFRDSFVSFAI